MRKKTWRVQAEHLVLGIDLIGTALFAAEGAATAMAAHLDFLGVLVLAFATALGGGILRDVLLGSMPPSAIQDWRYAATALVAGAAMFGLHVSAAGMSGWVVTTLDAAGLAFFAVAGATKAQEFGLHPLLATMMGGVTGVGGGTIRDVLINRVPTVLQADVYATAALLGAAVTLVVLGLRVPAGVATGVGIVACFGLRMVAVARHWNLPRG